MPSPLFPTPRGDTPWVLRQSIARLIAAFNALQNDVGVLQQTITNIPAVGSNGSNRVYKNSNFWLKDQYGLYHLEVGYVVEGQMQVGYENTGYTYATIP
jgi:hypothetical protein